MAMTPSQSIRSESETMLKRPLMPREIFDAAIKGDSCVLIDLLGLQPNEQTEIQEHKDSDQKISQSTKDHPFGSEVMPLIQKASAISARPMVTTEASHCATDFGDIVLQILVTKGHNKLALQVFQREVMLKAQNKMLETPLHCAAKARNLEFIHMIIRIDPSIVKDVLQETNEKGDTALHVAIRYYCEDAYQIAHGQNFSKEWFDDVMDVKPPPFMENKWERTQVIRLGSVLITTVTFAVAFTIPECYNQDHGTPVLGRSYMFWTFILANALSFILGYLSLFAILINALPGGPIDTFRFATLMFMLTAYTMVVTFELELYVTLAPVCLPIAIILLVLSLLIGSPAMLLKLFGERNFKFVSDLVVRGRGILSIYAISLLAVRVFQ